MEFFADAIVRLRTPAPRDHPLPKDPFPLGCEATRAGAKQKSRRKAPAFPIQT
jgi:hypothetical protein